MRLQRKRRKMWRMIKRKTKKLRRKLMRDEMVILRRVLSGQKGAKHEQRENIF